MAAGPTRADAELVAGLTRWLPAELGSTVVALARPATGWSNETVLVTTDAARFVLRLPGLLPAYPGYDLAVQADVLGFLGGHDVPAPEPLAFEADERWLGAPFLVMTWVDGAALGEVPSLDPMLADRAPSAQRQLHEQFVDALAAAHALDPGDALPGLRRGLADELAYWAAYLDWATAGSPPPRLRDALGWCRDTAPPASATVLLWGDVRLGNAMYNEAGRLTALLDWELASVGPPEMDLAWYVALSELAERFVGPNPQGLLSSRGVLARYRKRTGHEPAHLPWHQVFALVRSTAISECLARLARAHGFRYPGVAGDANPVLDVIWQRIHALDAG